MRGRILNRTFGRMAEATRVALQETYPTDYSFRPLSSLVLFFGLPPLLCPSHEFMDQP